MRRCAGKLPAVGALPCEVVDMQWAKMYRVDSGYRRDVETGILRAIPPVASTAGEGGKPPGGGHLRVVPVYLFCPRRRGVPV